jgi:hypothetical protein
MEYTNVYEAIGPVDTNEGRGGTRSYGFYLQHEIAKRAAKGKGVMGTDGDVRTVTGYIFKINSKALFIRAEDIHDILGESPEDFKARAKAKLVAALTPEELNALGLRMP